MCAYVATLLLLSWLRFPAPQWAGLLCGAVATVAAAGVAERGWQIGLFVRPSLALRDVVLGAACGSVLVLLADLAVILTTGLRHGSGQGMPWREIALVYVPAVVHEEAVFRGYPFQKLLAWNRLAAIGGVAALFAALHAGNSAVTSLGLTNVFLGGVLLGLSYEVTGRLWFPIGLHFAWNVVAGPLLGHEVSGYVPASSLLVERGSGAGWLTGGEFGIEGSLWMTAVTLAAVALLAGRRRRSNIIV